MGVVRANRHPARIRDGLVLRDASRLERGSDGRKAVLAGPAALTRTLIEPQAVEVVKRGGQGLVTQESRLLLDNAETAVTPYSIENCAEA